MLDVVELCEIEELLREEFNKRFEEILAKLNATGRLDEFLELIGLQRLLGEDDRVISARDGKIIVIGQSDVDKNKLSAVAKNMGFEKDRFEFYLNYEDAKTFDFRKIQWSTKYCCILVGPMPHSGVSKGDYGSVISALENQEGYPPLVRMGTKELKITKNSFREALEYVGTKL